MKLIVGLGNPGLLYKSSRHNIGLRIVHALAKEYKIKFTRDKSALYKEGWGKIGRINFSLAYPLVFMNLSGLSIGALVKKYQIDLENLLVICDDLDLPLGQIRIRSRGSSGGHKGMRSASEHLKSELFSRLRIGIGRPSSKIEIKDFVLSKFKKQEKAVIEETIEKAVDCCRVWLSLGMKAAMNQFNQMKPRLTEQGERKSYG